MGYCMVKIAQV